MAAPTRWKGPRPLNWRRGIRRSSTLTSPSWSPRPARSSTMAASCYRIPQAVAVACLWQRARTWTVTSCGGARGAPRRRQPREPLPALALRDLGRLRRPASGGPCLRVDERSPGPGAVSSGRHPAGRGVSGAGPLHLRRAGAGRLRARRGTRAGAGVGPRQSLERLPAARDVRAVRPRVGALPEWRRREATSYLVAAVPSGVPPTPGVCPPPGQAEAPRLVAVNVDPSETRPRV